MSWPIVAREPKCRTCGWTLADCNCPHYVECDDIGAAREGQDGVELEELNFDAPDEAE